MRKTNRPAAGPSPTPRGRLGHWPVRKLPGTVSMLATLIHLSCQPDPSRSSDPDTRFRAPAGVPIIENARPPQGSRLGWRVGSEPALSIGVLDGEDPYVFRSAPDATRLGDGRIVVVESGSAELRVFDGTSGTHLATWGGRGEGPGEFSRVSHVHPLRGDSIMVWSYLPIVTVLDPHGNYVRSVRPARNVEGTIGPRLLSPAAVLDDGSILASVYLERADTTVVEVWDAEGKQRGALGAHLAHAPRVWTSEFWHYETFGWNLKLATWGELAIVTPSDRYEIRAFHPDGTLARIVRMEHVRRSPTGTHLETYVEAMVSKAGVNRRRRIRRHHSAAPVADYFPAFSSVLADRLGHLWVEAQEVPGEAEDGILWTVFDPEGHVLGLIETPERLEIYEIGEHYLLGKVEGTLGVDHIQLWALNRAGGQ